MFKKIAKLYFCSRIIILFFTFIASLFLILNIRQWTALKYFPKAPYLLWVWANFDGINYLNIAINEYSYPNFAYFPLLPFLISLIHKFFSLPFLTTGLLITNLAFFLSLFVFYRISLLDLNQKIAWRALIFLLIFPFSFFYNAVYTESLYFLLATLSFYFARKSRWFYSGLSGFFAGLCRLVGVSLFPVLLLEWFLQNRRKEIKNLKGAFFLLLIPLGMVVYGLYLQLNFSDFFLFQKSMSHWGQDKFVFPPQVLFRYFKIFVSASWNLTYFVAVTEFICAAFYFFLSFYVLFKIRISYGIWMLISLLIPIFTGTLQSMPRYILHLFPAFIALALLTRSKWVFRIAVVIFLILQFIFVALFTRGYFIA